MIFGYKNKQSTLILLKINKGKGPYKQIKCSNLTKNAIIYLSILCSSLAEKECQHHSNTENQEKEQPKVELATLSHTHIHTLSSSTPSPSHRLFYHITQVLATEIAYDQKHVVCHNKWYEQVLVPRDDSLLGKTFSVKIVSAEKYCIHGEVI